MDFDKLHRQYRLYEALALYDAYYERIENVSPNHALLGDALPIAWVPLVFHCTFFHNLNGILTDKQVNPGKDKEYVSLTELGVIELSRFRSLRTPPYEVAIGFPRAVLEPRGLFQPLYLKHAHPHLQKQFENLPSGYVELTDDLGALHEVRVPGSIPISEAVWILTSKRTKKTKSPLIPELKHLRKQLGTAVSFWDRNHQEGMIREAVFRKVKRYSNGNLRKVQAVGKHYLEDADTYAEQKIQPPAGGSFSLLFPKELRPDTLKNGWEGPYSKYEMAEFFFKELKKKFPERMPKVNPRIRFE